jgi:succinoglycan biosynthesis protein ExoM
VFVIVENNDRKTCGTLVRAFSEAVAPARVVYEIEPAPGIAAARNRVLEIALQDRLDGLAFIDEGEAADPGWLVALVMASQSRGLHLTGGPVKLSPPPADATQVEAMVWRAVDARFRAIEDETVKRTARKTDDGLAITTNNWFADLEFVARTGVRFEALADGPRSEDIAFQRAMKKAGAKTGWVPKAIVYEEWPRERLTFSDQYAVGREQERSRHQQKFRSLSAGAVAEGLGTMIARSFAALLLLFRAPFDSGTSLVRACHAAGAAAGAFRALFGPRNQVSTSWRRR